MRFDDMLVTVLAREPDRAGGRVALWRQIVDLLAQRRGGDAELTGTALARFEALRAEVPVAVRREAAAAIAGRPLPRGVIALLAGDVPQVAGAVLARATLPEADWLALLPVLSPTGRGFLRHRDDLGPAVAAALAGLGRHDLTVTGPAGAAAAAPPPDDDDDEASPVLDASFDADPDAGPAADGPAPFDPAAGEGQIRSIISRIARFRTAREEAPAPPPPAPADHFHYETAADGVIRWVEGVPRGALIGETIARPAGGAVGVDAQAPGAFRRRAAFRDARLVVAGEGPASGAWRIAGVPIFAPADGRFLGYRGTARRPRADEAAEPAAAPPHGADTLRQVVHELRTPLNAIGGFAEMIRRQMRGPVAEPYRRRADAIAGEAGRLLAAVDDLDVAARLDGARLDLQRGPIDLAALLAPLCAEQAEAAGQRDVALACALPDGMPAAHGDAAIVRRMAGRLLAAAAAVAEPGEAVALSLDGGVAGLAIAISRPRRLAAVADAVLFDPGADAGEGWPDAPLLGLGFSLHLVRRLAAASGAELRVEPDRFILTLPPAETAGETRHG